MSLLRKVFVFCFCSVSLGVGPIFTIVEACSQLVQCITIVGRKELFPV